MVKEGFDKASTNRIAETAGVSVGSLYQYFPGKEALVAAVMERHNRELMQIARGVLAEVAALPMEQAVRKLVTVAIEAHRVAVLWTQPIRRRLFDFSISALSREPRKRRRVDICTAYEDTDPPALEPRSERPQCTGQRGGPRGLDCQLETRE